MTSASILHPLGKFALALVALAAVAAIWVRVGFDLHHVNPVGSSIKPNAVVWGGLVFTNGASFERWLHSRGARYQTWARRHPDAEKLIPRD